MKGTILLATVKGDVPRHPEDSVSALVSHHPDAKYFSLTAGDTERLERTVDGDRALATADAR